MQSTKPHHATAKNTKLKKETNEVRTVNSAILQPLVRDSFWVRTFRAAANYGLKKHPAIPFIVWSIQHRVDPLWQKEWISLSRARTFIVEGTIGITSNIQIPALFSFHTGAGPNLILKQIVMPSLRNNIQRLIVSLLQTANKPPLDREEVLPLHEHIGDPEIRVRFGVVNDYAVDIIVGTSSMNQCVRRQNYHNSMRDNFMLKTR